MTTRHHQFENSSMLADCYYDDETEELSVTFKNGRVYTYIDVPRDTYDGLTNAASPGKYFNSIKTQIVQKS